MCDDDDDDNVRVHRAFAEQVFDCLIKKKVDGTNQFEFE